MWWRRLSKPSGCRGRWNGCLHDHRYVSCAAVLCDALGTFADVGRAVISVASIRGAAGVPVTAGLQSPALGRKRRRWVQFAEDLGNGFGSAGRLLDDGFNSRSYLLGNGVGSAGRL
ncbi:hypothetical protein LZ32DRAFT_417828 [Colletotrichum eremochloae]|nr:hypothetical protein LZ32DRAFT_417828 [Colletotrichum eremochloae]